jgi:hypothetical protein
LIAFFHLQKNDTIWHYFLYQFFANSILILLSSTINILVLSKYSLIGWVLLFGEEMELWCLLSFLTSKID